MTVKRYLIGSIFFISIGIVFYLVFHQPDEPVRTPEGTPVSKQPSKMDGAMVNLYFANKDTLYLTAESRIVPATDDPAAMGRHIIEALIQGPQKGLMKTVPGKAAVRTIYVTEDGVAYVDLMDGIGDRHPGGSQSELRTIYSIVNSLVLNVPAIKSVKFLIGGREAASLAGHIDLRFPFNANMLMVR